MVTGFDSSLQWLLHDVFTPTEITRDVTVALIGWLLGWTYKLRGEKAKQRQWTAWQLLDGMRDLKQFAFQPSEDRPRFRIAGIDRLLRQVERAQSDSKLLNKKQNAVVTEFRLALSHYSADFGDHTRIHQNEREAWKNLIDKLFEALVRLNRPFSKYAAAERASLADLRDFEGGDTPAYLGANTVDAGIRPATSHAADYRREFNKP